MTNNNDITALTQALSRLAQRTSNLKPTLSAIAQYQERHYQQSYDANRAPDNTPWQPLAESTLAQKRNPKMLVEEIGRIPGSRFSEATNNRVIVGYGDPLAAIHDMGATIPARTVVPKNKQALYWAGLSRPVRKARIPETKIPARPLIGYTEENVQEWREIILTELIDDL
ncbi:MAG: phage virion morphogenesis protein [Leadbetterella sp.]